MAPPTKRDLIIFQLARITIWRQVEVGDGQLLVIVDAALGIVCDLGCIPALPSPENAAVRTSSEEADVKSNKLCINTI
jgi:hypothetical protein